MPPYLVPVARLVLTDAFAASCVAVLAIAPGLVPAWALTKRLKGGDWPTVLVLSFALTVASSSAAAIVAHFAGLSLGYAIAMFLVLVIAGALAGWRWRSGGESPAVGKQGVIVGAVVAVGATIEGTYVLYTSDLFYHMAAARSLLASGRPLVTDPLYGTSIQSLDPTSGSWHTLVAMWSRMTGLDVTFLALGFGIVSAVLVALAVWVLLRRVSTSPAAATWTTAAWLFAAVLLDFRPFVLPNRASLALVYLALFALVELASAPRLPAAVIVVASGFAAATMHLGSAQLLFIALAAAVAFTLAASVVDLVRKRSPEWRTFLVITAVFVLVLAAALPVVLPRAGVAEGAVGGEGPVAQPTGDVWRLPFGMSVLRPGAFLAGGPIPFVLGSVLAGWMVVVAIRDRERSTLVAAAFAGLPALLFFDPPVTTAMLAFSPYMTARIGALLRFSPYVAAAWALANPSRRVAFWLGVATLAALVWLSTGYVESTFRKTGVERKGELYPITVSRVRDARYLFGDAIGKARELAGDDYPRVAGDPETSYYMVGLAPFSTVATLKSHSPFAIESDSGEQRREAMAELLDPETSEYDRREILERGGASYVALWVMREHEKAAHDSMIAQPDLFEPVVESVNLVILRVKD